MIDQDYFENTVKQAEDVINPEKPKAHVGEAAMKLLMTFVASAVVVYFTGYFFEKGSIAAQK